MRNNSFEENNENFIDENNNQNIDNKQDKLSNEKTAVKSDIINIEQNMNENGDGNVMENEKMNVKNPKASFGADDIIEDNIKTTDTFDSHDKKKKEKENENDNYDGDEDFNSDKANKKIANKVTNFKYHIKINKKFLKFFTLVIIIIYIIITIIGCIIFHLRRDTHPFLFCFEFLDRLPQQSQELSKKDIIYFLTDLNSFYIIHIVFLIIFISVCYLLIKGKQSQIDYFFKDMSIFFVSTLIFNIPILFSGMFTHHFYGNHLQPIVYLVLTLLGFLCMMKIFIVAKRHKYKNISSLSNISILSSFMTAYQLYCFLFNLTYFYMNFFKPKMEENHKEYFYVEIIAGSIYFAFGVVVITVYKDIFFVIAMIIIENGLLYSKRINPYLLTTTSVNVGILSLNFASVIIIIFAYNKKVFKLKEKK